MAPKTQKNKVNRLDYNIPIVHADGRPTDEFQRKWLQQAAANATVPDLTTIAGVSAILDLISAVKGSLLNRGTTTWQALAGATGHDGWLLTWNDATGLPEWRVQAIGAIPSAFYIDGAGVGEMALVDANGQEVLDASGFGIYIPNPTLPEAMLPVGSATVLGGVKVDDVTVQAIAGLIGTKFCGFSVNLNTAQVIPDSVLTTAVYDTVVFDTLAAYNAGTGIFTPTKAGKWLFFWQMRGSVVTTMTLTQGKLVKNGATVLQLVNAPQLSAGFPNLSTSIFAFTISAMNGSTDNMRVQGIIQGTGGTDQFDGTGLLNAFGGIYLGP